MHASKQTNNQVLMMQASKQATKFSSKQASRQASKQVFMPVPEAAEAVSHIRLFYASMQAIKQANKQSFMPPVPAAAGALSQICPLKQTCKQASKQVFMFVPATAEVVSQIHPFK